MTEQVYNLDREKGIEESIDAIGKKWKVYRNKGNGLCFARPIPDRSDAVIPENMKGLWTKAVLLEDQIKLYVTKTWDVADKAIAEAQRTKIVAKENAAKLKVKNDTRAKKK